MNKNFINVLCNQVFNVAFVINEAKDTKINVSPNAYANITKFVDRMDSVWNFVQTLFMDYESGKVDEDFVNDKMIILLNTLVNYKNSYKVGGIAYKTMNSLLDIVKESFVELNK